MGKRFACFFPWSQEPATFPLPGLVLVRYFPEEGLCGRKAPGRPFVKQHTGRAMATTAPVSPDNAPHPPEPEVPEERFWQHYSPHGELPLSGAGSLALHLLIIGMMLFWAYYLALFFVRPPAALPVEPVRLELGGGGGSTRGSGSGEGRDQREEAGATQGKDEAGEGSQPTPDVSVAERPPLNPSERQKLDLKFDKSDASFLTQGTDQMKVFSRLDDSLRSKLREGMQPRARARSHGGGGTGSGGGTGGGKGTGTGDASGPGKATLSQREKRMLRWSMKFNTQNGQQYVDQLRALGAILAIPVQEGAVRKYQIVRDLRAPAQLLPEDISKINRIYWVDDNPRSVNDVMQALGVPLHPSHFVAFMPEELETKLFQMEKDYIQQHFPGLREDQIHETRFQVVGGAGSYQPQIITVIPKSRR